MAAITKQKFINVKWDMDTQETVKIKHNESFENIKISEIVIMDDFEKAHPFLPTAFENVKRKDFCIIDSEYITLSRETGGIFDNSNFDDPTIDRAMIIFTTKENN